MSRIIALSWIFAALIAAPAGADLYKWVDENGITNYSNQPPSGPQAARRLVPIDGRLSVYTPDNALMRAVSEFHRDRGEDRRAAQRIRALEQQIEAERQATPYAASIAPLAPADPCHVGFGANCFSGAYYPYVAPVVVVPAHRRPRKIPQIQLIPGTIAGNVVGMEGFIAGNSSATARAAPPSRPLLDALPGRAR